MIDKFEQQNQLIVRETTPPHAKAMHSSVSRQKLRPDDIFFTTMSVIMLAIVFMGFASSYFLRGGSVLALAQPARPLAWGRLLVLDHPVRRPIQSRLGWKRSTPSQAWHRRRSHRRLNGDPGVLTPVWDP